MKRWWRLVLKYEGLPDLVEAEWMEECCLDTSPEDCIERFNRYCVKPDRPRELIAAIPISGPTTGGVK